MPTDNPHEAQAASKLKAARRLAGLTQKEAADELEVTERTYARWERGESAGFLRELDRVAKAFKTTPEAILGGQAEEDVNARLAALEGELRALRALLLDPGTLRAAAEALVEDEEE